MLAVTVSAAHAGPRMTWNAPDGCPAAQDVQARVERRLAGATLGTIEARVERDGEAFVAHVAIDGGDERTLSGASCDALADAVALIAARAASQAAPPPPPPPEPIAIAITPPTPVAVMAPVRRVEHWRAGLRVAADGAIDVLPGFGGGGELTAYVERDAASAELGATWWSSHAAPVMDEGLELGHVDVALRAAVARVGWRIGELPVRVLAVADFGTMTGTGMRTSSGPWLAVGGGVRAWWPLAERVRVAAAVETELARDRVRFIFADGTLEYEAGRWSARGSLGLEVALW